MDGDKVEGAHIYPPRNESKLKSLKPGNSSEDEENRGAPIDDFVNKVADKRKKDLEMIEEFHKR